MFDFERDINLVKSGNATENLIYQKIVGLKEDLSGPQETPTLLDASSSESGDSSDSNSDNESEDENQPTKFVNSARPKGETTDDKRVLFVLFGQNCVSDVLIEF